MTRAPSSTRGSISLSQSVESACVHDLRGSPFRPWMATTLNTCQSGKRNNRVDLEPKENVVLEEMVARLRLVKYAHCAMRVVGHGDERIATIAVKKLSS